MISPERSPGVQLCLNHTVLGRSLGHISERTAQIALATNVTAVNSNVKVGWDCILSLNLQR